MFRRKLTIALLFLAAAAVLEGVVAVWALSVAERHVQRGRVASDIHLSFVELSATKQRLRTWLSQARLGATVDISQRERMLSDLQKTLQRLQALYARAVMLDDTDVTRLVHVSRQDSIAVLERSFKQLTRTVENVAPLEPGTDARDAWQALSQLFDTSDGRDLREIIASGIARETETVARERQAADSALKWMRILWLSAAATIALAAVLLATYFTRALRRPLDNLSHGALALERGELNNRIEVVGSDEFSAVAHSLNSMAAELSAHQLREAKTRHELEELVNARTAELQAALEAMQDMDSRRRQLFADISHELRTPTTIIRGEAEITLRGNSHNLVEYKTALQRIVDTARHLGLVIDDLLTMTRSDTDALALKRQPHDLMESLNKAIEQARILAHERNVRLHAPARPQLLTYVLGDGQRLRQMFVALLDNAVRYSRPGGEVKVEICRAMSNENVPQCEIRVIDHGIGIPEAELARVFDRNFRGESARLFRADGSGLGLSIAKWLAKAHGGDVAIKSVPDLGTTAILRLPLLPSPAELEA